METGLYYFKIVTEEKSISKAAERLVVTQQAVSDQLRRLEKKYGEKLYVSRPQFALTASGQALLETIKQIGVLEDDLDKRMADIRESDIGKIRFGIHASRLRLAFAEVMQQFHSEYPRVSIELVHEDTVNLVRMLSDGELDVIFCINPTLNPRLKEISLGNEKIKVTANARWLEKQLGYLPEKTIAAAELAQLPLIINPKPSKLRDNVNAYFEREKEEPRYIVSLMSFELQLQMAELGIGAAFCPEQVALQYLLPGQGHEATQLVFLEAEGMTEQNHLALVTYRNSYQPAYTKRFVELLAEAYRLKK